MNLPLLITNPTNIRYLTGFVGAVPDEREAFVLWVKDQLYLFTNALYREESRALAQETGSMGQETRKKPLEIVEISRENPLAKELANVLRSIPKTGSQLRGRDDMILEYEEENLTVAELKKLRKELRGVKWVGTRGKIEELRMIKREDEIESIKEACTITDQCFSYLLPKLTPGVEEREIAWEIEAFFRTRGVGLAFSPIVAFGNNSSKPHYSGRPKTTSDFRELQSRMLHKQDIALLDFGARVNGYCADMTRVVFIGKPKDEWAKAYKAVAAAQEEAITYLTRSNLVNHHAQGRALNSQLSGSRADRIARAVLEKAGFVPYPHSLGHAVGLDIHEAPRLTVKKDQMLKPGMVVSVEPGIYIEGQFGIRIEDLVLIKDDGTEVLSKSPKKLTVI